MVTGQTRQAERRTAMERNRGLSLVELLITVAILSIVMVIAVSFMMTGSRSFAKGNADSDVQKEAELTVNQIEDMLIDINGGVSMTDEAAKAEMIMYHAEDDGSGAMLYTKEAVTWNKSDHNIYCSKWKVNYDASADSYVVDTAAVGNYENQLLAENVTLFEVDLSDTLKKKAPDGTEKTIVKSVLVRVGYEDGSGRVEYATSPVITLRNRMLLSASPADVFGEVTPAADTLKLHYSGIETAGIIPIVDRVSEVQRGGVYNIYARINSGSDVNELVDWEIEETGTLSTIDDSGYLSVNVHEAHVYLTITAKYKSNPNKKATGVVKVMGGSPKSLRAVHIITKSLTPFEPKYDSTPETEGFTDSEIAAITYKWTVNAPEKVEAFVDNTDSLSLSVKKAPEYYNTFLEITLTAHSDVTGETVFDKVTYRIDREGAGGDSYMERGKMEHGEIQFWFDTNFATDCTFDWYFCDIDGNRRWDQDSLINYVVVQPCDANRSHFNYTVAYTDDLPPDQAYYLKVIVYLKNGWDGTEWQYDRIHYIPAVQLYPLRYEVYDAQNYAFYYRLVGYYDNTWATHNPPVCAYDVEEFEYESSDGVIAATDIVQTTAEGKCLIRARGEVNYSGPIDKVQLKSLKVKVCMKNYPSIYTYSDVIFE